MHVKEAERCREWLQEALSLRASAELVRDAAELHCTQLEVRLDKQQQEAREAMLHQKHVSEQTSRGIKDLDEGEFKKKRGGCCNQYNVVQCG